VLRLRHPDRRQLAGPVQPGQRRRVPPVDLDPLARPARNETWGNHHTVVATVPELPVDPVAAGSGLVGKAQRPTATDEPEHQLVERCRIVRELPHEPHLAIAASLRHTNGDRRLVHVQPDKSDSLSRGLSPVLRQGTGPSGATLAIPAQFEAGHPRLRRTSGLREIIRYQKVSLDDSHYRVSCEIG
jgi:hypothetical protein